MLRSMGFNGTAMLRCVVKPVAGDCGAQQGVMMSSEV